jgi:7,8-dihydroneopterin aldolase/epimerase/oxygenase
MHRIRLDNCAFFGRHGVLKEEATLGQRFYVDAELTIDADEALETDNVVDTVHYGEVFNFMQSFITERRFNLIEALAYAIAKGLMEKFPRVAVAEITVRKPSVPIEGILDGVSVTVVLP